MKYPFITITPRTTLNQDESMLGSHMFSNYSYSIRVLIAILPRSNYHELSAEFQYRSLVIR